MNIKQAKNFFCLGKVFVKKGEWSEAIAAYQKAIKLAPDWEEVKQYLADAENKLQQQEARGKLTIAEQFGKILATQGKSDLEKVAAGETIKVDSNLADDYHFQGDDLVEKGKKEEAVKVYRKAVEIQPELWEVHHKLGNLLQEKEELEAAVAAYDKSIELKSDFCWSYNNLGDVLLKLQKWEEAVGAYRRAIELNPDFPWAYYKLGDVLVQLERWDGAVSAYRQVIKLEPTLVGVHEKLADALHYQTRLASKEIVDSYKKAIQEKPDNFDNYYKILEIIPDDYQTNLQLAQAWGRKGDWNQAIVFCKNAIANQPNGVDAHIYLGDVSIKQEHFDRGIDSYYQALRFSPNSWELYLKLAEAQEKQKDITAAVASYKKASEIKPNLQIQEKLALLSESKNPYIHIEAKSADKNIATEVAKNYVELGRKLSKEGKLDEATDNYQKALQINPTLWLVNHDLGDILRKQGKLNEAVNCYRQALNINPNYFWSVYNIAKVCVTQKKLSEAIASYCLALKLQPNNDKLQEELNKLLQGIDSRGTHNKRVNPTTEFIDNLQESWADWKFAQKVQLLDEGKIIIQQDTSTPGIEKIITAVDSDCFYFIEYELNIKLERGNIFISVTDLDNNLQLISHEYLNQTGTQNLKGTSLFRTALKTKNLKIGFLVDKPQIDDRVDFKSIKLIKIAGYRNFDPLDYENTKILKSKSVTTVACIASVSERENMLFDVVNCLYPFVDKICVYLNNYSTVPDFLHDPKIEYVRSQDSGDFGDAGKFYWVEDKSFDIMCILDDDLLYPPNYVHKIIEDLEKYDGNAIIGCHGVFIKQPLIEYYEQINRYPLPFSHALDIDRQVHLLGTNTVAFVTKNISIKRKDFLFRNSADIWFALYANERSIPLISVSRPRNWVVQNNSDVKIKTIYDESHQKTNSRFDSSFVQSHALRTYSPLTIKPSVCQSIVKPKFVFAIKTWNRVDYLKQCVDSFLMTRSLDFEWVVIIADDGSTDGTVDYLQGLTIPHEFHVIYNHGVYACGQTNTIFDLSMLIGFDLAFHADDDIFFTKPGWDNLYAEAVKSSGYEHLCYRNWQQYLNLKRKQSDPNFQLAEPTYDSSGKCESIVDVFSCDGSFFTISPNIINRVGYTDEKNFPIRGQWHIDYSARCVRAGFNIEKHFFDAKNSNEYIELQANYENYRCSLPWNENYKKTKDPEELKRRNLIVKNSDRIYVSRKGRAFIEEKLNQKFTERQINCVYNFTHINDVFEKVFVLNLDRRQDRLEKVVRQTKKLGIEFERFYAVDGKKEPHLSEYQEYSQQPLVNFPLQQPFISTWKEFYTDKNSNIITKVAFVEKKNRAKAIASPGAWGYLKSYIAILTEAIRNDYESILVFDDDVIFHNDFNQLFSQIYQQLPNNWMILQLGALQYDWGDDWISWQTKNLYSCNGSSVGSHAVAIHFSAYPILLNYCLLYNLPFDIGPLTAVQNQYSDRCFVFYPNLAIQDVSESDISSSKKQFQEATKENNVYRWHLKNYGIYL